MRRSIGQSILLIIMLLALILGVIAIGFGFAIGNTSRHVTFVSVAQGRVAHYLISASNDMRYLEMANDPRLYIIEPRLFTPQFNDPDIFAHPYKGVAFVYDSSHTTHIDVSAKNTQTHLVGEAYHIVHITYMTTNGTEQVYTSDIYEMNPHTGYDMNNWQSGFIVMGVGAVLLAIGVVLLVVFVRVRRKAVAQQYDYKLVYDPTQQQ